MNGFAKTVAVAAAACSAVAMVAYGADDAMNTEDKAMTYGAAHLAVAARFREEAMKNSYLFDGGEALAANRMAAAKAALEKANEKNPNFSGVEMTKTAEDFFGEILPRAFFEETAANRWREEVSPVVEGASPVKFSAEQLSDFFVAAEVFLGPFNDKGAVIAYYNPWWDAILLTRTVVKNGLPEPDAEDSAKAPRIEEFEWLSGETFRGETPPPDLAKTCILTVVPEADPISVEVWRRQRATLDRFNNVYGDEPVIQELRLNLRRIAPGGVDRVVELNRIQVRAGLRLKLLSLQMKSEEAVGVAKRVTDLLRSSSVVMFKRHFTSPDHEFFCETFTQLNRRVFRKGFVPYGYVPTSEGALYVFVNAHLPRLYATVSMPKGLVDNATDKPAIFEWYDLDQATEHLVAWEEDKAAKASAGNADK